MSKTVFIVMIVIILLGITVSSLGRFSPNGDIEMFGIYGMNNATVLNSTAIHAIRYCNFTGGNCVTDLTASGTGDITAVTTNDDWLSGGANSGAVNLIYNESKLNDTIDARSSGSISSGDGNISVAGSVITLANLDLAEFQNTLGWITNSVSTLTNYALTSVINTWISTNSTADRAYTDTRVDSIDNGTVTNATIVITESQVSDLGDYVSSTQINKTFQINITSQTCSGSDKFSAYADGTFTCTADASGSGGGVGVWKFENNQVQINISVTGGVDDVNITGDLIGEGQWCNATTCVSFSALTEDTNTFDYNDSREMQIAVNQTYLYQFDTTGNSATATALAANGANCNAGEYPLGVDASGAVESCTDATTEINSAIATHAASVANSNATDTVIGTWISSNVTNANASMKVYVDAQDAAQDSCAEITGCVENALQNVVEDTTPQLGGNLDTNTFNITNIGGGKIWGNSSCIVIEGDDGSQIKAGSAC